MAAVAMQSPEGQLLERLHSKLAASFSVNPTMGSNNEIFILSNPGRVIIPADLEDKRGLSNFLNQVPIVSKFFFSSGAQVSTTYGTILRFAQASTYQEMQDRDKYDKAMHLLFDRTRPGVPTPKLAQYRVDQKQYFQYQLAYLSALEDKSLAATQAATAGTPMPPGLDQAIKEAKGHMTEAKGRMGEVDQALATLDAFNQAKAGAWLGRIQASFNAANLDDGDTHAWFPPLEAVPPAEEWLGQNGWKPFRYKQTELPLSSVSIGGGPDRGADQAPAKLAPGWLASLSLTMETRRVRIARPWLEASFFESQAWRLPNNCGFTTVSTGNLSDPDPGIMPLVITGLLLGRNLVIKGQWTDAGASPTKDGGPLAALGPFNLTAQGVAIDKTEGELAITCAAPQIIGFFCQVIPKSPNPGKNFR
jgi:hypothetical protein